MPGHYQNQYRQLKRQKNQAQNNRNCAGRNNNGNGSQTNSNSNKKISNNTNANNTNNRKNREPKLVYPPCETCFKTNNSAEKCYIGANAANRPPPRKIRPEGQNQVQQRNVRNNSNENIRAAAHTLN